MDKRLEEKVRKAILKGIQATGDDIFDLSQQTDKCYVPVDTGTLKKSGDNIYLKNGTRIVYIAPYSAVVEYGKEASPVKGEYKMNVRKHKRKSYLRKDGTKVSATEVKAYEKVLEGKRPISFRPKLSKFERGPKIFRVISEERAREGQFFLSRAVLKNIHKLPGNIEFFLRRI